MGATLDIQRQQRMDMLDQQLLLAQYNEARRNARQQQQVDRCKVIALPINKPRKHMRSMKFGTFVFLCVAWVVTVDQVVPLPETQRTEPTSNATPPPGSDAAIYAAPTTGQLSGCGGAGGSSFMSLWTCRFLYIFYHLFVCCLHLSTLLCPLQVARLVEMGFSRIDALEALRASNNDINMATNFLLQH